MNNNGTAEIILSICKYLYPDFRTMLDGLWEKLDLGFDDKTIKNAVEIGKKLGIFSDFDSVTGKGIEVTFFNINPRYLGVYENLKEEGA